MFTGRTIEELIQTVEKLIQRAERTEQHAREQDMKLELKEPSIRRMEWQETTEVA